MHLRHRPDRVLAAHLDPATMACSTRRLLWIDQPPWAGVAASPPFNIVPTPRQIIIQGLTRDGKTFRPSDWAERLAGAMSSFRPGGATTSPGAYLGYSPLCVPRIVNGCSSVIVDESLREVELLAWDFVMNFARDNDLVVIEPEAAVPPATGARPP